MAANMFFWIHTKCAFVLFIFFFTYLCFTNGVNSQSIRNSPDVTRNTKEPPDLFNQASDANSMSNLSDNKLRNGETLSNRNQMRFLCRNRLPVFASRRNIPAQTTRGPYKIITPPDVRPGQVIDVTIQSLRGRQFRDFMLQGLSADVVTGEFQPSPKVNLQTCYSNADTANPRGQWRKRSVTLQWKVPDNLQTNIVFRATIVQNVQSYWVDVMSDVVPVISGNEVTANLSANGTQTNASTDASGNTITESNFTNNTDGLEDLKAAVSDTFERIDGPMESLDEVLTHQGIREVTKLGSNANDDKNVIHVPSNSIEDDELTAPKPTPQYIYRAMNMNPLNFEPPQTSEFLGTLLKMGQMMGGGNSAPQPGAVAGGGSMGGLGSMMNMMSMLGGGGGGGGLMSSLSTMNKLRGMMGGGGGGGGMPGGLGALSGLMGGGNRAVPQQPAAPSGGGGLGMLSSLGGLLGGLGKKKSNNAPPPVGQPVKPQVNSGEPSLADLLGVDPDTTIVRPTVITSEINPLSGVAAAKSGGLLSSIGGFAPMLAGIPLAMKVFGGKKKQQQPPWGQQGMPGQNGQFGQMGMPGQNGQFGQMGMQGQNGQFGAPQNGQFGAPPNGQFGAPQNGQFGAPPNGQFGQMPQGGQNGQFGQMGGANGQFGQMGGASGQFGQMQGGQFGQSQGGFGQAAGGLGTNTFGQTQTSSDTDRIIKLLEQQRMEIEALKNQFSGNSIVNRMGSFGNIPLSFGQPSTQLVNSLPQSGSTLLSDTKLPSSFSAPSASSSANDALLQQLMQQNQMLLQQNQQFNNAMTSSSIGANQFGTTTNPFSRVNRSNGQMVDSLNPSNNMATNFGTNNLPQNQFNNAGGTMGKLQNAGQNAMGGLQNSGLNAMGGLQNAGQNTMGGFQNNAGQNTMGGFQNNAGQNNMMNTGGSNMFGGQQGAMNQAGGNQGMGASPMSGFPPQNQAQTGGGGGSLANMFGGSGGSSSSSGGMSSLLGGGGSGGGLAGLMGGGGGGSGGGGLAGLMGGGGGGGGNPLASLMGGGGGGGGGPLAGLLGGGGGAGGPDISGLMQNVDMNAMQSVLGGKEGQDLMNNMMGMLQGPDGGNLMKAVEGVMSGQSDAGEIQKLMSGMDMGALTQMASQAEGMLSKSGIDPSTIMGLMG